MRKIKIGDVYGFLEVKEFIHVDIDGKKFKTDAVKCKCLKCGEMAVIKRGSLLSGNTKSCGCYRAEASKDRVDKMKSNLTYVDGTLLESIMSKKVYKNNKSGVRGVHFKLVKGKYPMWRAKITCCGKTYEKYFQYDELNLAIEQRKKWEEELFQPIIEEYLIAQ